MRLKRTKAFRTIAAVEVTSERQGPHATSALAVRRTTGFGRALGLSPTGGLSILAVVLVLVLVSLPRLREFALHQNERDALETARLVARAMGELGHGAARPTIAQPTIAEVVEEAELGRQLSDAETFAEGRLLRRHGYLFEVVRVPALAVEEPAGPGVVLAAEGEGSRLAVRAWPWAARADGGTGGKALLALSGGAVLGHPNPRGLWSGPERPPTPTLGSGTAGWKRLR